VPPLHIALDVHATGLHVLPEQDPPLQSVSPVHAHEPLRQNRPVPHWLSFVQAVCWQLPAVAPEQLKPPFGQSAFVAQGSEHCPKTPRVEPLHVPVKPQSVSLMQLFEEPTSAFAETWKSL
jgi:hypothetical protein